MKTENRSTDDLKYYWSELKDSRRKFLRELYEYLFDILSPRWLNYLILKKKLKNMKTICGKEQSIKSINFFYERNQFSKRQRDILINIVKGIPEEIKKAIQ